MTSNKSGVEEHTILCIESGTTISTMHINYSFMLSKFACAKSERYLRSPPWKICEGSLNGQQEVEILHGMLIIAHPAKGSQKKI